MLLRKHGLTKTRQSTSARIHRGDGLRKLLLRYLLLGLRRLLQALWSFSKLGGDWRLGIGLLHFG